MKFSLSWLQDHLATTASLDEILALMLKAGLEVEHVDNPAERLSAFTVCKVKDAQPHPDADKLRVCTVDTVDGEKQIVCVRRYFSKSLDHYPCSGGRPFVARLFH